MPSIFYVHPTKPRSVIGRYVAWPFVFAATLWFHPNHGIEYAVRWANRSLVSE